MPVYRVQAPDGSILRIEGPEGATAEQLQTVAAQHYNAANAKTPDRVPATPRTPTTSSPSVLDVVSNAANKGLAALPDQLLNAPNRVLNLGKAAVGTVATAAGRPDLAPELTPDPDWGRRAMKALGFIRDSAEPTTTGGRVLDTLVQGAVGGAVAPANALPQLIKNMGIGGASALASDVVGQATGNDALAISAGMLTPAAMANARQVGQRLRPEASSTRILRDAIGDPAKVPEVLQAILNGRELVPGSAPMLHQVANSPELSQLARTVKNIAPGNIARREGEQNAARIAHLEGIAPGAGGMTSIEAATNAGNVLRDRAATARDASNRGVSMAYEGVDPFGQSRVLLPLEQVKASLAKYFGDGAGAPPAELASLAGDVQQLGTTKVPSVLPQHIADIVRTGAPRPSAGKAIDYDRDPLNVAVRKAGGLDLEGTDLNGELRGVLKDGGSKASVVHGPLARRGGRGETVDQMADRMFQHGYIEEPSGPLLLEKLAEDVRGSPVWSMNMSDDALAATRGAFNDMPPKLLDGHELPATVPFQTVQNMRSRASESAYKLGQAGERRGAAVATDIKRALDDALAQTAERAAAGQPLPGEYFAPDQAAQFQQAKRTKAGHEARFGTGPSGLLFKDGSDGAPRLQGAEAFRAFFNPGASQAADIAQLNRMMLGDRPTMQAMQQGALADLLGRAVSSTGTLGNNAFQQWTKARAEALPGLLDPQQMQRMSAVGSDLQRAALTESLGRATGSNTAQNLEGGILFSRPLDLAARMVPVVGKEGVEVLRNAQRRRLARELESLILDPKTAAKALEGRKRDPFMDIRNLDPEVSLPGLLGLMAAQRFQPRDAR